MDLLAPVLVSAALVAAATILGRLRYRNDSDAREDAGLPRRALIWNDGGIAGAYRAFVARPRARFVHGTVKRIEGNRILIAGPTADELRERWFTVSADATVSSDVVPGAWVRIRHVGGLAHLVELG